MDNEEVKTVHALDIKKQAIEYGLKTGQLSTGIEVFNSALNIIKSDMDDGLMNEAKGDFNSLQEFINKGYNRDDVIFSSDCYIMDKPLTDKELMEFYEKFVEKN